MKLATVHTGDAVTVVNNSDGTAKRREVIAEDGHSLAIEDSIGLAWWFYRDTGAAYAGDAYLTTDEVIT